MLVPALGDLKRSCRRCGMLDRTTICRICVLEQLGMHRNFYEEAEAQLLKSVVKGRMATLRAKKQMFNMIGKQHRADWHHPLL